MACFTWHQTSFHNLQKTDGSILFKFEVFIGGLETHMEIQKLNIVFYFTFIGLRPVLHYALGLWLLLHFNFGKLLSGEIYNVNVILVQVYCSLLIILIYRTYLNK